MASILKVYTAEQLYEMYRLYLLGKAAGLTDFNEGSVVRTLLESQSDIISSIGIDFKEAIYRAIPIALYQGFGFDKLGAVASSGYIRPYRQPVLYIEYTGSGTAALITSNSTGISATCTGAGADDFSLAYASYPTAQDLVTAIDALTNWSATLVKSASIDTTTLYQYTAVDVLLETNYLNDSGVMDIMLATDIAVTVPSGYSVTIDSLQIITSSENIIVAGESGVQCAADCTTTGIAGNIAVNAIDTANGKGYINSVIEGIENVINDSAFSGGTDEETDTARQIRFTETVNALNAGTKNGIIVAIEGITGVRSAGMRTNYPFKGSNTIIIDTASGTISADLQASIEQVLYGVSTDYENYPGKNCEGIEYILTTPTIKPVDVTVTVTKLPTVNVDSDEIETDVQTAIEQYINTRKLGEDVIITEIIRIAKNANAAVYDITVTLPATNVSISDSEYAKTGSGTGASVTVTVSTETSY